MFLLILLIGKAVFTLQMPTTGRAGPGRSQESRTPSGGPMWMAGTQALEPTSAAALDLHQQTAGSEVE